MISTKGSVLAVIHQNETDDEVLLHPNTANLAKIPAVLVAHQKTETAVAEEIIDVNERMTEDAILTMTKNNLLKMFENVSVMTVIPVVRRPVQIAVAATRINVPLELFVGTEVQVRT